MPSRITAGAQPIGGTGYDPETLHRAPPNYGISGRAALGSAQPPDTQASQQLGRLPTHALPCLGRLQSATLLLVLHLVAPFAVVRQQVTKPGFPQIDRAAQAFTAPLQRFGSVPAFTAPFATRVAQRTKAP